MRFCFFNLLCFLGVGFLFLGCAQQQPTWGGARGPDMRVGVGVGNTWGSRSGVGFGVGTSVSFPIGIGGARTRYQRELEEYRAYLKAIDLTNQERTKKGEKLIEGMTFEQWRAARDDGARAKR
jgi:hypothetical protein